MSGMEFLHPERIHLVWVVVALVALLAALEVRRGDALRRMLSSVMQGRLVLQASRWRRSLRLVFVALTGLGCVVALMRPQVTRTEMHYAKKGSADIFVVLDVSKSMLAADVAPNRLERAKAEVRDMLPALEMHRVGLIAFAGRAAILAPLTTDHAFFRLALESADPRSVSLGGTRIGDAIRKALDAFGETGGARAILLITDGEDQGSSPLDAAHAARSAGVPIVAVGFGSEEGSQLQVPDAQSGALTTVVDHRGVAVVSRMDGELLREIAMATKGVFIPAGTGVLDLEGILETYVLPLVDAPAQARERTTRTELFQWFIAGALLALLGAMLTESRLFSTTLRRGTAAPKGGSEVMWS